MMHFRKRAICLLLIFVVVFSFCGCSNNETGSDDVVELLNPVDVKVQTVRAEYRDILDGVTYSGKVVPTISDVSFASGQSFLKYGVLPGSEVKKGDTVIYASTENIDNQIKQLKEQISSNQESYDETIKDLNEEYESLKFWKNYWEEIYQYILANPDYIYAEKQTKIYQNYLAQFEEIEQNILKTTSLYEIDSEYSQLSLKRLTDERKKVLASAQESGTIVAINYFSNGDYISKDQVVAAVGDFNSPVIACEYISKNDINKAERFYAIINGKRYEVEYINLDKEQYNQLLEKNDNVYSTFTFKGDYSDVTIGDYVSIVLVQNDRSDVLSLPTAAIGKDDQGSYVTVVDGESNASVYVKTGETHGLYTEILSGINEGDEVLCETKAIKNSNESALKAGHISSEFTQTGYLYYPKREWVNNPIEYGTTYIEEVLVKRYERVSKGQVIATVSVTPNTIDIQRKERSLLRANEDLDRFIENNKSSIESNDEKIIKQLNQKKESIADLEKLIATMKSDSNTKEIKATSSGIVTDLRNYESGAILNYNAGIIEISSEDDSYVVVEDENGQLTYGNIATIKYNNKDGIEKVITGEVVSVSPDVLSKSLKTGYSLIKVSPEDLEDMANSSNGFEGWWNRSRFNIVVKTRSMDNVVLVPKSAVTKEGDTTYVAISNGDGTSRLVSFIAGGSDVSYYWVAEGLTEGTIICLE